MENMSKIKACVYIQQKSGKLIKEKKEFDSMDDLLKEARRIEQDIHTYTFHITSIFKGGKESGDVVSWDGKNWGGSYAVSMVML